MKIFEISKKPNRDDFTQRLMTAGSHYTIKPDGTKRGGGSVTRGPELDLLGGSQKHLEPWREDCLAELEPWK